jgi:rRNA maturation RNase YbeY
LNIRIFYDNTSFRVKEWRKLKNVIVRVIRNEKRISGDLSFIITDDGNLRNLNIQFLEHDYNTDVITFDYNDGKIINGEVYISIDTVKLNAANYKVSLSNEMNRVILHGILHLLGYDDKSENDKLLMRKMEDLCLNEFYR